MACSLMSCVVVMHLTTHCSNTTLSNPSRVWYDKVTSQMLAAFYVAVKLKQDGSENKTQSNIKDVKVAMEMDFCNPSVKQHKLQNV